MTMKNKILLALVLGLTLATYVLWSFRPQPPEAGHQAAMVKVVVPELSQTAKQGAELFELNCARCHGKNAAGRDGIAPPLIHKIYEPGHHADISFQRAAQNGVRAHHWRFGDMPPVPGVSQGDVAKIVGFIREVQRANGIN